jgi:hypothetical protein
MRMVLWTGAATMSGVQARCSVRKQPLVRQFVLKTSINLPRQARDKHRENSRQTDGRFLAGAILSKDAVFYLATDARVAPLIEFAECDEVAGGR